MAWLCVVSVLLAAPVASWAKLLVKVADGQCNGGVGGTGEHYCLIAGTCNEGGTPVKPPTEPGTGCPKDKEYLLCEEDGAVDATTCKAACEDAPECVAFLVTRHKAAGKGRCELHTKAVEYTAKPLECYIYDKGADDFMMIGLGACRTKELTVGGPQNKTRYGNMEVAWVNDLDGCKKACKEKAAPECVGIEYHSTANTAGDFKCEMHMEELSASEMSTMECWAKPTCKIAHECSKGYAEDALETECTPEEGSLPKCTDDLCCKDSGGKDGDSTTEATTEAAANALPAPLLRSALPAALLGFVRYLA